MEGRIIRIDIPVHVFIERHPTNEARTNDWIPYPEDVTDRIRTALKRGDDDYGWDIVAVQSVRPEEWERNRD